jgi:hypothetical protein
MKYSIHRKIKQYIFFIEEGKEGFLMLDNLEGSLYLADCASVRDIEHVECVILNNYDWDNCPEEFHNNLIAFGSLKKDRVLNFTKKDNKFRINSIDNQYYLSLSLELDPILLISTLTDKRTSFNIENDVYTSSLTRKKYKIILNLDNDPTFEYKVTDFTLNVDYTYWMATAKCYYCFYDLKEGENFYSPEELVDLAGLEFLVYEKLYNMHFKESDRDDCTKNELEYYLKKHKNFLLS